MLNKQKKLIFIIVAVLILVMIFLIKWLKPDDQTAQSHAQGSEQIHDTQLSSSERLQSAHSGQVFSSQSQQDIQINCQIEVDASNRLVVNENTKNCFEFFITQYGEKSIDQIKTDFVAYAKNSYKEPLLSQIIDLWSRYIQYRESLSELSPPNQKKDSAAYYKAIFSQMSNLRKKYFSDYEIEGLFGLEDNYNDYTLNRMAVLENNKLTEAEKAQKLKELFDQLPEDWKENLKQLSQLEDLRKLTSEIKARGGSPEELRQMRMSLVGPEATQRLEKLDTQRSQWKSTVNQYLSERDNIMKSNMSEAAKTASMNQLKSQYFKNSSEQLRAETFEKVHDQGGKLPFAD